MKKIIKLFVGILMISFVFALASCGGGAEDSGDTTTESSTKEPNESSTTKKEITGLSFIDETVVYDGKAHTIYVIGELPDGVYVEYINGSQIEVYTSKFNTYDKPPFSASWISTLLKFVFYIFRIW